MALDQKITELDLITKLENSDLIPVVQNVGTSPINRNMQASLLIGGWIPDSRTWSYSSADSPSFVVSVNADMTGIIGVGMKIRLTQNTTKYFIVTAVGSYSGGATPITLYGGTDYTLANAAISNVYYSIVRSPFGFPMNPSKWTVTITDTTTYTKSNPSTSVWYSSMDSGSLPNISIPIGLWNVSYKCAARSATKTNTYARINVTLSTSASSETDADFTVVNTISAGYTSGGDLVFVANMMPMPKILSLSSKTPYYLLIQTPMSADVNNSLQIQGSTSTTILKAVCAYL